MPSRTALIDLKSGRTLRIIKPVQQAPKAPVGIHWRLGQRHRAVFSDQFDEFAHHLAVVTLKQNA
jgi:hypothetical protein